jgi:CDP-diacylglycerol---glycerol-3-phosphate 3-phosphatidyltransferase
MISDYLRRISQPLLRAISGFLARTGITPNALSLLGFALNLAVAVVLATGHLRWGGLLIIVVSLFDGLDGALARYTGKSSVFGAFLDSTLDRYSEAGLFVALVWHFLSLGSRAEVMLACVALFGSEAVSYTRARAEGLGLDCKVGWFTRAERMIVLALGLALGLPLITLWVLAIFTNITSVQRILYVRRRAMAADAVRGGATPPTAP